VFFALRVSKPCRLGEADALADTISAAGRFVRDPRPAAKLAATRLAGALVAAEVAEGQQGESPSLPALQPVLIAVLGLDQLSDVQRAALQVELPPQLQSPCVGSQ